MRIPVILILLFAGVCWGGPSWNWLGPPVGEVQKIEPDPNHPHLWFVILEGHLYRSQNGGDSWKRMPFSNTVDVAIQAATSHVFVLQYGDHLYLIWRSLDHGRTFQLFSSEQHHLRVYRLRFNPLNSEEVFAVGQSLVRARYRKPWEEFTSYPIDIQAPYHGCSLQEFLFQDVLAPPFQPGILYAAGAPLYDCSYHDRNNEDPFLMISWNNGRSWKVLQRAPKNARPFEFHFDSRAPEQAFITGANGISMLTRRGIQHVGSKQVRSLRVVPQRPKELFGLVFLDDRNNSVNLLHSTNGGKQWTVLREDLMDGINEIAVRDSKSLFAGLSSSYPAKGGLYVYQGGSWRAANTGIQDSSMSFVHTTAGSPVVYAGNGVLYTTTDKGRTWVDRTLNLPVRLAYTRYDARPVFTGHPTNPEVLYLTGLGLYRSQDAGQTWSLLAEGKWRIAAFDPQNTNVLYLTKAGKANVYRSSEGGKNPEKLPLVLNDGIVKAVVNPNDPQTLFFVDNQAVLHRSTDGGRSAQVVLDRYVYDVLALPEANRFLATTSNRRSNDVYFSTDNGTTWSRIGGTLGELLLNAESGNRKSIWAYSFDMGIFESFDGGRTWNARKDNPGDNLFQLTDPRYQPVYAATGGSGLANEKTPGGIYVLR